MITYCNALYVNLTSTEQLNNWNNTGLVFKEKQKKIIFTGFYAYWFIFLQKTLSHKEYLYKPNLLHFVK